VLITLIELMRERILALGRFGGSDFAEHKDLLLAHRSDPEMLHIDRLLGAWGRSPRNS